MMAVSRTDTVMRIIHDNSSPLSYADALICAECDTGLIRPITMHVVQPH
jgi:hypothetical protein